MLKDYSLNHWQHEHEWTHRPTIQQQNQHSMTTMKCSHIWLTTPNVFLSTTIYCNGHSKETHTSNCVQDVVKDLDWRWRWNRRHCHVSTV